MRCITAFLLALALLACHDGGSSGKRKKKRARSPLLLSAGVVAIEPSAKHGWVDEIDLERLALKPKDAKTAFDLTTPAGEPFVFDILSRSEGNTGPVRVSLAHASDGGVAPAGGVVTMATAGVIPSGTGTTSRGEWLDAHGDGFARITLRGAVERDQVFAVQVGSDRKDSTALIRVRIGPSSEINSAAQGGGDYPGVVEERTLYSSDSWSFGLPTIAVSGDRTSIVCYEGDRGDPRGFARYEMRLQHEQASGKVTGGASEEASEDSGNWRDHEIAALFNVLALVHSGTDRVTVKLSFDRGATFAQEEEFLSGGQQYAPRLVTIAMALDYSLAVLFWRANPRGATELVLVEGRPSELDGDGSPTRFEFDAEHVVYRNRKDVTPLLMGATWSEGGDLVVGYAFSRFTTRPDRTWESVTQNRCAVRPWGGEFSDVLVEEDRTIGRDPSVSVTGKDDSLRVYYAYEARDGVRYTTSDDAGRTFAPPVSVGDPASHTPTIIARDQGGETRVDLIYLTNGEEGQELHVLHWDDFGRLPPVQHRLTHAVMTRSRDLPPDAPVPGAEIGAFVPDEGYRITQVSWFGYDAVLDGDDVVVVYDEETFDAWFACVGPPFLGGAFGPELDAGGAAPDFTPAEPPPLAPGLTEPVPDPDPEHMHQLRLLRMD
ncbi:MAG: hypothetical protein ACYTDY_01725 [Planctomycetota bacterium]